MTETIKYLIISHATTGGIALAAGLMALIAKKGKRYHIIGGKIFYFSMLLSAVLAMCVALLPGHESPFLFSIGVFSSYFLLGGRRAITYKRKELNLLPDHIISIGMIVCGIGMIVVPLLVSGEFNIVMGVFGIVGLAFAVRDLALYRKPDHLRENRIQLHLGKMMGGYISAVTAFIVVNQFFSPALVSWFLPSVIGTIYITYWMNKLNKKSRVTALIIFGLSLSNVHSAKAQVYIEKQTRHRFAQLNLGLDVNAAFGDIQFNMPNGGNVQQISPTPLYRPRFMIGGTHFWGHADFFIAIPLTKPKLTVENREIYYSNGVETGFKYYPARIKHNSVRPFVGLSIAPYEFQQTDNDLEYTEGPLATNVRVPILAGLTYNRGNHLLDLTISYNTQNELDYYVTAEATGLRSVHTPATYIGLSYRYMLETTLSAEKDWESGVTKNMTEMLEETGRLNTWFIGAGMSSAWWLGQSEHNTTNRPYMTNYGISVMPDFTVGYYLHKPDVNLALNYRGYGQTATGYQTTQELKRRSVGLEVTKLLFDYHGFVPFIGPVVSYENLQFLEYQFDQPVVDGLDNRVSAGLTFGWDIRPNRLQGFLLRTNLRYFPFLDLETSGGKSVAFNNLEFNFIQLIIFPQRMF